MEQSRALTKYLRIPPRKARLAAGLIRGLNVESAIVQLQYSALKGGRLLLKTLKSAVANAETNHGLKREELKVQEVRIDVGPIMRRSKSKNRGGRVPVNKRTSHFTVVVGKE
ncbi:MAG: 50S ribosomal protein L22 [Verrucomicrobia bacterium]|nr:50S ribosomal protein L22 [Verrucomicrobiota bacterium]